MYRDTSGSFNKDKQLIKVLPFSSRHIKYADICGPDVEAFNEEAVALEKHPSVTLVGKDGVLLFLGIVVNGETGYVWLVPTTLFKKRFCAAIKVIKDFEEKAAICFNLKKLVTVGEHDATIERWLKWVGFRREAVRETSDIYTKDLNYGN